MQITLYRRSYPVQGAPVALSLIPYPTSQRHTFAVGAQVYEAESRELQVVVPEDAKVDTFDNRLSWATDKKRIKSTASEVFGFAEANVSGFQTVR